MADPIAIEPFTIAVDEAALSDLRDRIGRTRWPDHVAGSGWTVRDRPGVPALAAGDLGRRVRLARAGSASSTDSRTTAPGSTGCACTSCTSAATGRDPLPIVLTHGFPSSFVEHLDLLPLLTDPAAHGGRAEDAFDVVITSLPGLRLLRPADRARCSRRTVADLWCRLMRDGLGYRRFGAHGSDVGYGCDDPARPPASRAPGRPPPQRLLPGSAAGALAARRSASSWSPVPRERAEDVAYSRMQSTKPQTVAYGLTDSPAGLAAWVVDLFRAFSDCGGDDRVQVQPRADPHQPDPLLADRHHRPRHAGLLRLRALRDAGTARDPGRGAVPASPSSPTATAPAAPGRRASWPSTPSDVTRWTEMPRGGHFAALEEPELLAGEIREFFRPLRVG